MSTKPFLNPERERVDNHVRADEVKKGDQLHLTVMGGDEYVEVTFKRDMPDSRLRPGHTLLKWESWGGEVIDRVPYGMKVWVKK